MATEASQIGMASMTKLLLVCTWYQGAAQTSGICKAFDGINSHGHQHTLWLRHPPVVTTVTGVGQDSGNFFDLGGNMSINSDSSCSMSTNHGPRQHPSTRHHSGPKWQAGHHHQFILHHAFCFRSASYPNKEIILFFFLPHFSITYLLIISCHVGVFHLLFIRQAY